MMILSEEKRNGLAAYYGTRALKQAGEGRSNNAESLAKAAAHHAFATVGRYSFGFELPDGTIRLYRKKNGERSFRQINPMRNEFSKQQPTPGLCQCEML